jgi:hypothetical protein
MLDAMIEPNHTNQADRLPINPLQEGRDRRL